MDRGEVLKLLEFYADERRWEQYEQDLRDAEHDRNTGSDLGDDRGEQARKMLARIKASS